MRSLAVLLPLLLATAVSADIVTLTNGTSVEGSIRRTPDGYLVTAANGSETLVPFDQVKGFKKTAGPATPESSESSLDSLRHAAANMDDLQLIISRYRSFIGRNANTPAAADAQKDLDRWRECADKKMVKAGTEWVTPGQYEKLKAAGTASADRIVPLIASGQLRQAAMELDRALAVVPGNADLQYLKGVVDYKQSQLAPARAAFQAAAQASPDSATAHNNAAVALAKVHSPMPALAEFEKAMNALPYNKVILDNINEVLHALPPVHQKNDLTKRVVETFNAQDAVLQRRMADAGFHRWGSKWVDNAEFAIIQQQQKSQQDKIDDVRKQFDANKLRMIEIERQINDDQILLNQMAGNNVMQDNSGKMIVLPPPPRFYDIQRDQMQLRAEYDQKTNQQNALNAQYQQLSKSVVSGMYTGVLNIFEAEAHPSAPPPQDTIPTTAPAAPPAAVPATQPSAPQAPKMAPNLPPKGPGDY